jgi:hypothetical protein
MPHPSPPHTEQGHDDMPHPSPARTEQRHDEMQHPSQQAHPIHEQQVSHEQQLPHEQPICEEQVAPGTGDAQVDKDVPEWEAQNKIPIKIRPSYVGINDVSSVHKWMAHDQFKPKNQVKEFRAPASKEGTTSKLHKGLTSIQLLITSNGQMIARINMKKARPSYQTESYSACHVK